MVKDLQRPDTTAAIGEKLDALPWVYWLDLTEPGPQAKYGTEPTYAVSIVIANEDGHYPTGDERQFKAPWYWTQEYCAKENAKRGYDGSLVMAVVLSSMVYRRSFRRTEAGGGALMAQVEVIHGRDPDFPCDLAVFIDGVEVSFNHVYKRG